MTLLVPLVPLVPPIVLLGPPGAGKTAVGPLLASALGFSFVDLDDVVGVHHLVDEGLASFRVREHLALIERARGAVVVAAGAGIADTAASRAFLQRCLCLTIDVDVDTALPRLLASASRPWLQGAPDQQRDQWMAREAGRPALRAALSAGCVDGRQPFDDVAAHLRSLVEQHGLGCDAHDDVDDALRLGAGFVVADAAVAHRLTRCDLVVDVGIEGKRLATVERILEAWSRKGIDKRDGVTGVGGGAVLDLVGLAAGLYQRGAPWRAVPTTLLAMVDAALGGKTAVDLVVDDVVVRNAAGLFHAPASSCVWPGFLSTLPPAGLRHGRAEMLKHELLMDSDDDDDHVDGDDDDDDRLAASIRRSRGLKRFVVDRDPYEAHLRMALNLGHTFAHAFESRFGIAHGDAVLHGLSRMLQVSVDVAGLSGGYARSVMKRIDDLDPPPLPALDDDDRRALLAAVARDKKGAGRLVLLRRPGRAVVATVDDDVIAEALARI